MPDIATHTPLLADQPEARFERAVRGAMIGAVLEWYDFVVYGMLAATVLAGQFFPKADPKAALMLAFGTQAIGFAARPLGGIFFGHLGDKLGRKPALILTYTTLGAATAAIGLLPTYAAIGLAAPLLLLALRFVQGLAMGGEFGAAITLVSEHSTRRDRGFWVSIPQTGGPAGTLLAALVITALTAALSTQQYQSYGWRVAFLIALPLLAVGAWLRRSVEETPLFQEAISRPPTSPAASGKAGLRGVLTHWPAILQGFGARIGENVGFYIYNVFVIAYATKILGYPTPKVFLSVTAGAAVQLVMMLLGGALSDRVGRRPVMLAGAAGLALWAPAFFALAQTRQPPLLLLAVCVGAGVHGLLAGPEAAWISELFPTRHRTTGVGLAAQGSAVLAGGPAPLIATALLGANGQTNGVVIYLMLMSAVSFIAIWCGPETKGIDLDAVQ